MSEEHDGRILSAGEAARMTADARNRAAEAHLNHPAAIRVAAEVSERIATACQSELDQLTLSVGIIESIASPDTIPVGRLLDSIASRFRAAGYSVRVSPPHIVISWDHVPVRSLLPKPDTNGLRTIL